MFIVYSVVTVAVQLGNLLFALYQLYITFSKAKEGKWAKWSLVTGVLMTLAFGSLLRVITFLAFNWLPPVCEQVMFNLAVIIWIAASYSLFLYW